jgi:hypothetical protein
MREVHVECKPDEALVRRLGINRNQVTHHAGKSRVFAKMKKSVGQIALVDEDPGSPQTSYEKRLVFRSEEHGIKEFEDDAGNRVLVLTGKLEDWVVDTCKKAKVDLKQKFNLPNKPNDLHGIINDRIGTIEALVDYLLSIENPAVVRLKDWLTA